MVIVDSGQWTRIIGSKVQLSEAEVPEKTQHSYSDMARHQTFDSAVPRLGNCPLLSTPSSSSPYTHTLLTDPYLYYLKLCLTTEDTVLEMITSMVPEGSTTKHLCAFVPQISVMGSVRSNTISDTLSPGSTVIYSCRS